MRLFNRHKDSENLSNSSISAKGDNTDYIYPISYTANYIGQQFDKLSDEEVVVTKQIVDIKSSFEEVIQAADKLGSGIGEFQETFNEIKEVSSEFDHVKDEINASIEDGYLTISAAKGLDKDEKEKDSGKYIRKERYAGACQRSFYVGEGVKQEDVKAEFKHGILKLTVPKKEPEKEVEEKKYIAIEG